MGSSNLLPPQYLVFQLRKWSTDTPSYNPYPACSLVASVSQGLRIRHPGDSDASIYPSEIGHKTRLLSTQQVQGDKLNQEAKLLIAATKRMAPCFTYKFP